MKHAARIFLLVLSSPAMLFLSSCGDDPDEPIPNYLPNETIQKMFLWGYGSWWAYEDTVTGEQDTFHVDYHYSTDRNVYEGKTHIYSDYYYRGKWVRTKENSKYTLEYVSSYVHKKSGLTCSFLDISSHHGAFGNEFEKLFYTPWPWNIGDSMSAGFTEEIGTPYTPYLHLLEKGDSLFYQNRWNKGKYYWTKIGTSLTNSGNDVYFLWQENVGLVEYNIDGKTYRLVNHVVLKP